MLVERHVVVNLNTEKFSSFGLVDGFTSDFDWAMQTTHPLLLVNAVSEYSYLLLGFTTS